MSLRDNINYMGNNTYNDNLQNIIQDSILNSHQSLQQRMEFDQYALSNISVYDSKDPSPNTMGWDYASCPSQSYKDMRLQVWNGNKIEPNERETIEYMGDLMPDAFGNNGAPNTRNFAEQYYAEHKNPFNILQNSKSDNSSFSTGTTRADGYEMNDIINKKYKLLSNKLMVTDEYVRQNLLDRRTNANKDLNNFAMMNGIVSYDSDSMDRATSHARDLNRDFHGVGISDQPEMHAASDDAAMRRAQKEHNKTMWANTIPTFDLNTNISEELKHSTLKNLARDTKNVYMTPDMLNSMDELINTISKIANQARNTQQSHSMQSNSNDTNNDQNYIEMDTTNVGKRGRETGIRPLIMSAIDTIGGMMGIKQTNKTLSTTIKNIKNLTNKSSNYNDDYSEYENSNGSTKSKMTNQSLSKINSSSSIFNESTEQINQSLNKLKDAKRTAEHFNILTGKIDEMNIASIQQGTMKPTKLQRNMIGVNEYGTPSQSLDLTGSANDHFVGGFSNNKMLGGTSAEYIANSIDVQNNDNDGPYRSVGRALSSAFQSNTTYERM